MNKNKKNTYIHSIDRSFWFLNENICRSDELTPLNIDRYNGIRKNENMDFHSYWELLVVFKGKGQIRTLKQTIKLRKYCVCLIPPDTKHAELSNDKLDTIWIGLKGSFLDRFDNTKIQFITSEELTHAVEQLWLKSIKSFGPIGPELDGLAYSILGRLLRLLSTTQNYSHKATIEDTLLYINRNYADDLNIALISQKFGFSESYFYRIFKKYIGQSPLEYITDVRIKNAIKLMKNSSLSIKRISRMVGFNDPLYFSRMFTKKMGQSPKKFCH